MADQPNSLAIRMRLEGADDVLRAIKGLPKEATRELRQASLELSKGLARDIAQAGRRRGGQAALIAGTAKAKFDRVPAVKVGGSAKRGRNRTPASDLLIGSEFGHSGQGGRGPGSRNYAPHGFGRRASPNGLWIYPTVRRREADISAAWLKAADAVIAKFEAM